MGYLPSNCDVAEQSRQLELQDDEDVVPILIFERRIFEDCPLPKKIPKFEQEQMVAQLPGVVKSVRSGKWMIFLNKKKVDQIWRKVKILMAENELGNEAKVTRLASDRHLISLYTYDFEDVQDLFRMDKPKHQGLCTATDQSTQCAGFGSAKKQQPGSCCVRKDFGGMELKEIFYNPPQVLVQPNAVDVSVQGSRVGLNETNSKRFEKLQASGNIGGGKSKTEAMSKELVEETIAKKLASSS
uniref:Uncharacterized protein n=1 Tax=Daphnia galeata TaxID=27404 RepID=A0A8J2WJ23_9CRUS|nr:unnamed protein product [Daphnia galeata]